MDDYCYKDASSIDRNACRIFWRTADMKKSPDSRRAIIFDLDGTLWNALPNTAIAWNKGFRDTGLSYSVTENDLARVVGRPFDQCVKALFPGVLEKYPELLDNMDKHEIAIIKERGGLIYDGVKTGIASLSEKHLLFIVSNCQTWYLEAFLDFAGIRNHFTDYDCFGTSNISKAEMIKGIVHKHNLSNAIYIGDTVSDYHAAKEAGTDFIHAVYGFGVIEENCRRAENFDVLVRILN